jgi:hypothetical protein
MAIQFVFASEEYNEFVDSPFNDVIAIFVNGVDYAGKPVSVNSIDAGSNSTLFVDNTAGGRSPRWTGRRSRSIAWQRLFPMRSIKSGSRIADMSDGTTMQPCSLPRVESARPATVR